MMPSIYQIKNVLARTFSINVDSINYELHHDLTRTMFYDRYFLYFDGGWTGDFILYDNFYCKARNLKQVVENLFNTKLELVRTKTSIGHAMTGVYRMNLTDEQKLEYTMTYFS